MQLPGLSVRFLAILAVFAATASGCQNMNHAQQGAATGAGLGGILGAVIGHQSGNKELGALLGAGTGAIAGHAIGNGRDMRDQRDAVIYQAHQEREHRAFIQKAVTDREIVDMAQQGLPDDIIIGAINERGGRFDTSPANLRIFNDNGVSNTVIKAMQRYNSVHH
jgi:uncharacterized protein YcfJ